MNIAALFLRNGIPGKKNYKGLDEDKKNEHFRKKTNSNISEPQLI